MAPRAEDTLKYGSPKDGHADEAPVVSACKHLLKPNGSILGREVGKALRPLFPTFASAIPTSMSEERPALASIDGRVALSHQRVFDFIQLFGLQLHTLGFGKGDRIALVLPNGPELALAIMATAHWSCCVPLSANGAVSELEADLARAGVNLVIGPYSSLLAEEKPHQTSPRFQVTSASDRDFSAFRSIEESAGRLKIPFVGLVPSPSESGIFSLQPTRTSKPLHFHQAVVTAPIRSNGNVSTSANAAEDEVLILFTSGTTGNKKLVAHQMGDMLTAATTIAISWDLKPTDTNCNLMPLFHVGGIVRQVFSPIFSGGCVICCPAFDPSIFWTLLLQGAFTWYYAAPTMHQMILQTGKLDGFIEKKMKLRMIANAAGGLIPSLAEEMMVTFGGANVRTTSALDFSSAFCKT
jgi:acyl-coenzyme A synthetase/AMP-(fatty) acid ligase